jgi:hypothetical protein
MTREEIIKLAREAGLVSSAYDSGFMERFTIKLERFAALVAAAEREECAKVVEIFDRTFQTGGGIAGSIRARGE